MKNALMMSSMPKENNTTTTATPPSDASCSPSYYARRVSSGHSTSAASAARPTVLPDDSAPLPSSTTSFPSLSAQMNSYNNKHSLHLPHMDRHTALVMNRLAAADHAEAMAMDQAASMIAASSARARAAALNSHLEMNLSEAAMAMDSFAIADRVAMMSREATAMAASSHNALPSYRNSPYNFNPYNQFNPRDYYSNMASLSLPGAQDQDDEPIPDEVKTFPEVLFDVINNEQHAHLISWLHHGRSFFIDDKELFAKLILPTYFDGGKFTSFTRRLKRWGFERITIGPEVGAFHNKHFTRDNPEMAKKIKYKTDGQQCEEDNKNGNGESNNEAGAVNAKKSAEEEEKNITRKVQESLEKQHEEEANRKRILWSSSSATSVGSCMENQTGEGGKNKRQLSFHVASVKSESDAYPQDDSPLAKRLKATASSSSANSHHKNFNDINGLSAAQESVFSQERRLQEIQNEFIMAHSMSSRSPREVGVPELPSRSGRGAPLLSFAASSSMTHHNLYTEAAAMRRKLEVERATRILEEERVRREAQREEQQLLAFASRHSHLLRARINDPVAASNILGMTHAKRSDGGLPEAFPFDRSVDNGGASHASLPTSFQERTKIAIARGEAEGIGANNHGQREERSVISDASSSGHSSSSSSGSSSERLIVLNRQEQSEFAEYLSMKNQCMRDLAKANREV